MKEKAEEPAFAKATARQRCKLEILLLLVILTTENQL